ncbi:MAG: ABC transporter ATP-binding protein [Pirellulaceae bacterium]|nr:MAG: ABC transporter ATP-binding protein [Pirellulaceae bacterium]
MHPFFRAIGLVRHYRGTLIACLACSLLVALLWGGNIGALYPVFQVILHNRSLPDWLDDELALRRRTLEELQAKIGQQPVGQQVALLNRQKAAEQAALERLMQLRPWVQRFAPRTAFGTLLAVMLVVLLATAVKDACLVGSIVLSARLNQLITRDLQQKLFSHVLRLDPAVFSRRGTAGMMSHMYQDINAIAGGMSQLFGSAVREPLKMVVCLAGAAFVCWQLLLLSLVLAPAAAVLLRLLGGSIRRATHRLLRENMRLQEVVLETFHGLQVVQSFGMESHEEERFVRKSWDCYRRAMRIAFYSSLAKPITELLGLAIVFVALLAGTHLVLNQQTTLLGIPFSDRPLELAELLVFYGLLIGAADPARRLSDIFGAVHSGIAAAERFFPVLEMQPVITDPPQPRSTGRPHRKICFDRVTFAYTDNQPVLQELTLEIPFGQTIALVGPNGSGKTTLLNLLLRFYDPLSGAVRLDEVDLREMALADLRSRIGVVSQQFPLFNDTVFENIRYGSPDATLQEVVEAARRAHCHRFIEEQLEHGYQTVVGENGSRLSGGQRQRIALARAMLRDPEILLLDEATSQVDVESEQLIHKALEQFKQGRTVILVTHRWSTLSLADRIVVLEKGRVVGDGTHQQLIETCPAYQRLREWTMLKSA